MATATPPLTPIARSPTQMNRPKNTAQMKEMTPWSIEGGRGACTSRFYDPEMADAEMAWMFPAIKSA